MHFLSIRAETPLFFTDFCTTPAEFVAAAKSATAKNSDDTLLATTALDNIPKEVLVDGCKLSINSRGAVIVVSKESQAPVAGGDYATATKGRLGLKQAGNAITMPEVPGPCTITYHAAASSATAGRGVQCFINGVEVLDAGFSELLLNRTQVTRRMVYTTAVSGPVVVKLSGVGGIYMYDVKIVADDVGILKNGSGNTTTNASIRLSGLSIVNDKKASIQIFNPAGAIVLTSNKKVIDIQSLTQGMYVVRGTSSNQQFTIIR